MRSRKVKLRYCTLASDLVKADSCSVWHMKVIQLTKIKKQRDGNFEFCAHSSSRPAHVSIFEVERADKYRLDKEADTYTVRKRRLDYISDRDRE